ncbi:MAG: NADPH-dependent FMN reductase [Acidobacteriota bacterium]
MRVLAFAGSLRSGSLNRRLLDAAIRALEGKAEIDRLDLRDVPMPLFDADLEERQGLPAPAREFKRRIEAADAVLIATPEYNNSIPGPLKNAIDWASRPPSNPFRRKTVLLMGASPGRFGAVRGVLALREVLTALFATVIPNAVHVAGADGAFDDDGNLKDPDSRASVERACSELLRAAGAGAQGG